MIRTLLNVLHYANVLLVCVLLAVDPFRFQYWHFERCELEVFLPAGLKLSFANLRGFHEDDRCLRSESSEGNVDAQSGYRTTPQVSSSIVCSRR